MGISAQAQSGVQPHLSQPEALAFPEVITYLTLRTADGLTAPAITSDNLQLLEDDQPVPEFSLESITPGLQLAVAINADSAFAIRDSQGNTRFDFLREALLTWGKYRTASDDLSLLTSAGDELPHASQPSLWVTRLQETLPDLRESTPNYQILSQAIDLATDPSPRDGMGRAVLFITPLPESGTINSLQSLVARANQQNVALFFWVVTSATNFERPESQQLQALAAQTGGQVFFFSGNETIPDLETWFAPLRKAYRIRYTSPVRSGEEHTLQAQITLSEGETLSVEAPAYRYLILPPNPIFIEPPVEILRHAPTPTVDTLQELLPAAQPLKILVDFPDGHKRDITVARLYVDGELLAENTSPPYTTFTWDLNTHGAPGDHRLQVEVVDSLGLHGKSAEIFTTVQVQIPQLTFIQRVQQRAPLAAGLATALILLLALWYLLITGRLHSRKQRARKGVAASKSRVSAQWRERIPWRPTHSGSVYLGQLVPLQQNGHRAAPIRIVSAEVIIGASREKANVVMQHPSIAPAHARLVYTPTEGFRIYDLDTPAGTWCNYQAVPSQGLPVQHGDIIHIGARAYRLLLPRSTPRIVHIEPAAHPNSLNHG